MGEAGGEVRAVGVGVAAAGGALGPGCPVCPSGRALGNRNTFPSLSLPLLVVMFFIWSLMSRPSGRGHSQVPADPQGPGVRPDSMQLMVPTPRPGPSLGSRSSRFWWLWGQGRWPLTAGPVCRAQRAEASCQHCSKGPARGGCTHRAADLCRWCDPARVP